MTGANFNPSRPPPPIPQPATNVIAQSNVFFTVLLGISSTADSNTASRIHVHVICSAQQRVQFSNTILPTVQHYNFNKIKYSRVKIKNQKHIAVDVLFKGFQMIQLSFRSNLAGRYL